MDALLGDIMARFLPRLLKGTFILAVLLASVNIYSHFHPAPIEPMTPQRRAEHRIVYLQDGEPHGVCTGTAIGPHAILTASHCAEHSKPDTIRFDMSKPDYHIEKTLTDGRDHDIYLVDGPAFTNTVPYKVRESKAGEHVYLFGSGHAVYPPRRLDGYRADWDDPSDVDADNGIVHFSLPVIPGDSGSAVFNDDGTIAAVTTYQWDESWTILPLWDAEKLTALDFVPAFTAAQIKEAMSFVPTPYVAPAKPAPPEIPAPFSFFIR